MGNNKFWHWIFWTGSWFPFSNVYLWPFHTKHVFSWIWFSFYIFNYERVSLPALNFFFWSLHLAFHFDFGGTQKTCNALGKLNVLCTCKRRSQTNQNPSPDYLIYPTDPPLPQSPPAAQSHSAGEEWLKKKTSSCSYSPCNYRSQHTTHTHMRALSVWTPD